MGRGLQYSLLLHAAVLLLVVFGFPALWSLDRDPVPMALSVEILPISDISNIPKTQKIISKTDPAPTPKEAPATKPKPATKTEKAEPKKEAVPLPDKPEPIPTKKQEEKPKPKEEPKPAPKQEDDFEQLLKDLSQEPDTSDVKETPKKPTPDSAKSKSDSYDPTKPLSISEKDSIRSQLAQCWRMPAGVRNDYQLIVEVQVLLNQDGSVKQAGIAGHQRGRYGSDSAFRAAADSALRAVKLCSPLKNLPMDKYSTWSDMIVTFDPSEMLY